MSVQEVPHSRHMGLVAVLIVKLVFEYFKGFLILYLELHVLKELIKHFQKDTW